MKSTALQMTRCSARTARSNRPTTTLATGLGGQSSAGSHHLSAGLRVAPYNSGTMTFALHAAADRLVVPPAWRNDGAMTRHAASGGGVGALGASLAWFFLAQPKAQGGRNCAHTTRVSGASTTQMKMFVCDWSWPERFSGLQHPRTSLPRSRRPGSFPGWCGSRRRQVPDLRGVDCSRPVRAVPQRSNKP
jgi:hypothetical protein